MAWVRYQDDDVARLVEAMDQLLDDMGKDGQSVCGYAKALARVAFEPFRTEEADAPQYTLEDAQAVIQSVNE